MLQMLRRPLVYIMSAALVAFVGVFAPQLGLLPDAVLVWWPWLWGAALGVIGLVWLVGPRPVFDFAVAAAGGAEPATDRADLTVACGASDLTVSTRAANGAGEMSGVVVAGYSALVAGPEVSHNDGQTRIRLERNWMHLLNYSDWAVGLAVELPWRITLESGLGNIDADLGALEISQFSVVTDMGDVRALAPTSGGRMHIATAMGDIAVRVPPDLLVDIRLETGAGSQLTIDSERFVAVTKKRWQSRTAIEATGDNPGDAPRLALTIETRRGDVTVF